MRLFYNCFYLIIILSSISILHIFIFVYFVFIEQADYKNKIARLEEKLRQVSDTAKVTRKDIQTAFAPNKKVR